MVSTDASIVSQVAFKGAIEVVTAEIAEGREASPQERVEDLTIVFAEAIVAAATVERLNEVFGATEVKQAAPQQQQAPQQRAPQRQSRGGGGGNYPADFTTEGGLAVRKFDKAIGEQGLDALAGLSSCPKCGAESVWDNRSNHPHFDETSDGSPKRPYFRCTDKSCGEGFWPPNS